MTRRSQRLVSVAIMAVVALVRPVIREAAACAVAPPHGEEAKIVDEEAIIAWDAATKTETFIRRAEFAATAKAFGFLVPTPTTPVISEADAGLFAQLASFIRPRVVTDTSGYAVSVGSWFLGALRGMERSKSAAMTAAPAVRVIQTAHVAGMDATTLEADDAAALAAWLGAHGFEATPALTVWLDRYVQNHWKLTAFVIATDENIAPGQTAARVDVASRAVQLVFHAEQPMFPYREPAFEAASRLRTVPRTLRVFLVADQRYTGRLEGGSWNASTLWSGTSEGASVPGAPAGAARLTVFFDEAATRPDSDLTFVPHSEQGEVKQRDIVVKSPKRVVIPVEGVGVLVIGAVVAARRRRQRVRSSTESQRR